MNPSATPESAFTDSAATDPSATARAAAEQAASPVAEPTRVPPSATTVVLVRHGRSTANVAAVLAGRSTGVELDDAGAAQAAALVQRFADVPIAAIVSSPLERCQQTVAPLAQEHGLSVQLDEDLVEVDYGSWTGRPLKDLGSEPMWRTVQQHPSAAVFPDGEALAAMAARAVAAVRRHLAAVAGDGVLVICSHGDVIKAILADALGTHLDQFQRISVAPSSISVIRYTEHRPFVERLGDTGTLQGLGARPTPSADAPAAEGAGSDAVPGGDTGAASTASS